MTSARLRALAILAAAALPARSASADWSVAPTLRWRESYSDNINLAPPASAQGELVSELAPALSITGKARGLTLKFDYTLERRSYRHAPASTTHNALGSLDAVLLDDWLYAQARTSVSRQNLSPFGPQAIDPASTGANTSTVKTNSVTPALRHRFAGVALLDASYDYESVKTGGAAFDVTSEDARVQLASDRPRGAWGWDAFYSRKRQNDPLLPPVHLNSAAATLRLALASHLGGALTSGYDSNDYRAIAGPAQGRYWSAALRWAPDARTSIAASRGHRFYGSSYGLDAARRTRRSAWRLAYGEDITSTRAPFAVLSPADASATLNALWADSIPDPLARQRQIDQFLGAGEVLAPLPGSATVNYFSHSYYLQKLWTASVATGSAHSTLLLSLSQNSRTVQSATPLDSELLPPGQANLLDKTRQRGVDLVWDWQCGAQTTIKLAAARARIDSELFPRSDSNTVVRADISRRLGHRLEGAIELRRVRHDSNAGGAYREAAVSATLNLKL
ncbi:MAG: TIGR03016 family PEP-CTERM system-associated outer membrane protein [Pseudomonadota bacterium]